MASIRSAKRNIHRVRAWDLATRLFHWLLVGAVGFALVTGFIAPRWWVGRHILAGYGIAGLLTFRAVWAFYGSEYSRFDSFAYSPRQAIAHFRGLLRRRRPHYLGHNPSGAMMIFALFGVICLLVATGFLVQGGMEKQGPLAGLLAYDVGSDARRIHKLLAFVLLGLICFHLAGVFVGSCLLKEPLIRPMIDGWKPVVAPTASRAARPVGAFLWLCLIGAILGAVLPCLLRLPARGLPAMPPNATMIAECGACHGPFHPSVLPRASWARLMASLSEHFGEDASLPPAKRDEIALYLERYAAEAWDTRAAHGFVSVSPGNPISITATPGWRRLHASLDPALFRLRSIGTRSNCAACHTDADSGRFDAQAIRLPPEQ